MLVHAGEPGGNVTVGDEGLPRPWNPLPCAGADVGPFGGPGFPAPIDVLTSPPNPNGLPPTPGIPIAGRPGDPPPDVPGTPVPLPPQAPPGARTENLATGRPDAATVDVRAGPAAGTAGAAGPGQPAAGAVHQPGRSGR